MISSGMPSTVEADLRGRCPVPPIRWCSRTPRRRGGWSPARGRHVEVRDDAPPATSTSAGTATASETAIVMAMRGPSLQWGAESQDVVSADGQLRTRWRRMDVGQQALLTVAHLRGSTPIWPAESGSPPIRSVVVCAKPSIRWRRWPTRADATKVARAKAFVIFDGTLSRDRRGRHDRRPGPAPLLRETV